MTLDQTSAHSGLGLRSTSESGPVGASRSPSYAESLPAAHALCTHYPNRQVERSAVFP